LGSLKPLFPTMEHGSHTLSPIEAQRAIAIIEETVEKLSFLGSITPDVLSHRDELSKFVGDEISRIINDQSLLEAKYEDLITERSNLKGLANKSRYREVQEQIAEVSRALRESTKQLCRNLKDNPNISGNLIKIQRERSDLIEVLQASMKELKANGSFNSLAAQVASNRQQTERMATVVERERTMAALVTHLDHDLTEEKAAHQISMQEQKQSIAKLKEELQSIKSATTIDGSYMRKLELGKTSSLVREQTQAEKSVEAKIRTLEDKLEMERVVHEESVNFMNRKFGVLTAELEEWCDKLDVDLATLDMEYEALKEKQLVNRERLDAMQARKASDDAIAAATAAEKQRIATEIAEEALRIERETAACKKIQIVAREYLKRKAEQAALSGKKKKGGKKGKKKK